MNDLKFTHKLVSAIETTCVKLARSWNKNADSQEDHFPQDFGDYVYWITPSLYVNDETSMEFPVQFTIEFVESDGKRIPYLNALLFLISPSNSPCFSSIEAFYPLLNKINANETALKYVALKDSESNHWICVASSIKLGDDGAVSQNSLKIYLTRLLDSAELRFNKLEKICAKINFVQRRNVAVDQLRRLE